MFYPIITLAIVLAVISAVAPAYAEGVIDVGQAFNVAIAPYINAAVNAFIVAIIGWIALKFKQKTGIDIEAGHRDAIARALQNQAGSLIADGMASVDKLGKVTVSSASLAQSVNDLMKSVPDAVKHFGITPDKIAQRIVDTIPQLASTPTPVATPIVNIAAAQPPKAGN